MVFSKILYILIFIATLFSSSCFRKGKISVSLKERPLYLSEIKIKNNEIHILGKNLTYANQVWFHENESNAKFDLEIHEKSDGLIRARSKILSPVLLSRLTSLFIESANSTVSYPVSFSMCESLLGGKEINCSNSPSGGDVLYYDAITERWSFGTLSGQVYRGVWNATTNIPDLDNLGTFNNGDYYIVATAGTYSGVSYSVGDWVIFNGTSWEKIDNSSNVVSSFQGRKGVVALLPSDYVSLRDLGTQKIPGSSLGDIADIDLTVAPTDGQVLKWSTGSSAWIPANDVSGGSSGIALTDLSASAPLSYNSGTGSFSLPSANILGLPLTGLSAGTGTIASTDTILGAFGKLMSVPSDYVSRTSGATMSTGTLALSGTAMITVPTATGVTPTEVTNVTYVNNAITSAVDANGVWNKGASSSINYIAGNVGIGTNSPSAILDVVGESNVISGQPIGSRTYFTMNPTANSSAGPLGVDVRLNSASSSYNYTSGFMSALQVQNNHYGTGEWTGSPVGSATVAAVSNNRSTGTMTHSSALSGRVINNSTGTVSNAYALTAQVNNSSTGTITNGYGLYVLAPNNPSGVLTNYYGLYIANPSQVTNSYSIYSEGGTNYLAGKLGIGTNNPSSVVEVAKEWGAVADGQVVFSALSYSDATRFTMGRANGTISAPTAVLAGDSIGNFNFRGHNGVSMPISATAGVAAVATENHSLTTGGTALAFRTTTNGTTNQVDRIRIEHNGNVGIGTSAPGAPLDVKGAIRMSGSTSGYTGFQPAATAGSTVWTLPNADGSSGQVLSTNGAGVLSWITPSGGGATSVFGRSGVVTATAGDYTGAQITNTAAGNIAATTTQAAINELDTEKQSIATFAADVRAVVLTGVDLTTNAVITATDSVLSAFGKLQKQIIDLDSNVTTLSAANSNKLSKNTPDSITSTVTVSGAGDIVVPAPAGLTSVVNKSYVDNLVATGSNQWIGTTDIYRAGGKVGIGTTSPSFPLDVKSSSSATTAIFESTNVASVIGFSDSATTLRAQVGSSGNDLFFQTNGSERLRILGSNGNVGVGTSTPSHKLDVVGDVNVTGSFRINGTAISEETSSAWTTLGSDLYFLNTDAANDVNWESVQLNLNLDGTIGSTTYTDTSVFSRAFSTYTGAPSLTTSVMKFGQSSLLLNGSSCIQETAASSGPAFGDDEFTVETWVYHNNLASVQRYVSAGTTGSAYGLWTFGYSTSGSRLNFAVWTGSGYVDYFSSSVAGSLTAGAWHHVAVVRTANVLTFYVNGASHGTTAFSVTQANGGKGFVIGCREHAGGPIEAMNGYIDEVRVSKVARYTSNFTPPTSLGGGKIGIGTTTPATKLQVVDTVDGQVGIRVDNTSAGTMAYATLSAVSDTAGINVESYGSNYAGTWGGVSKSNSVAVRTQVALPPANMLIGTSTSHPLHLMTTSNPRLTIDGSGSVGVGTTTPSERLHVVGNILASGTVTGASDIRLKKSIRPITDVFASLGKLRGVRYFWKNPEEHDDGEQLGLIAQDVEKVFPQAVKTDNAGFKSVAYMALVAPIVEAVKQLHKKILNVDKKLNELVMRIVLFENKKADKVELQILREENAELKKRLDKIEKHLRR